MVTGMEKAKEEIKKHMAREMTEREERSANVLFYGMEESQEEEAERRTSED